ncbi:MAG: hypothetical protein N3E36_01530 [Sulfolobales archaeon]|nr:hypothetical protein [Sulfolobales archaeon]MCX8198695.1 hypothetical protein [Sulfolobales archaeon]MDW8169768.1 hypothetical protein [Desulfurococcaceae archaeon]
MSSHELEELKKDLVELRDRVEKLEKEVLIVEDLLKKIIFFYALSLKT